MNIYLIRHGKTKANEEARYIGKTNMCLSTHGIDELLNLKSIYNISKDFVLLSSPLKRCIESTELLFNQSPKELVDNFSEINFGDWELKRYVDLKDDEVYCKWLDDFNSVTPPRGEATLDFRNRVLNSFAEIVDKYGDNDVYIVTHGGVIRTIMSYYFKDKEFFEWSTANGLGFKINIEGNKFSYKEIYL